MIEINHYGYVKIHFRVNIEIISLTQVEITKSFCCRLILAVDDFNICAVNFQLFVELLPFPNKHQIWFKPPYITYTAYTAYLSISIYIYINLYLYLYLYYVYLYL